MMDAGPQPDRLSGMTLFVAWQNFYVIMGSSAGALIGLQFVVLSFITGIRGARLNPQGAGAFATPAIVHFAAVLGLSGILCAPWDGAQVASSLWGLVGVAGIGYVVITFHRIRAQTAYRPEFEDWLFHILLPFAAYLILAGSAYIARVRLRETLFGVGAAALLLLFSGIHNAWDAVTYHVLVNARHDS
jgi:hypothetical protein